MVVYKLTNLITNKIYIGIDTKDDPNYLGSGTLMRHLIAEYGKKHFKKEILEKCASIEELKQKEQYWIKKLDSYNPDVGYNIHTVRIDKEKKPYRLTSINIDKYLIKSFKIKSAEMGVTLTQIVSDAIHNFVSSSTHNIFESGSIGE